MTLRSVLTNDFDSSVQCLSLLRQLKHHPVLLVNLSFVFDTSLIHPPTHSPCPVTTLYDAPSRSPSSVSVCHRLQTQCCIPTCTARYLSVANDIARRAPIFPFRCKTNSPATDQDSISNMLQDASPSVSLFYDASTIQRHFNPAPNRVATIQQDARRPSTTSPRHITLRHISIRHDNAIR